MAVSGGKTLSCTSATSMDLYYNLCSSSTWTSCWDCPAETGNTGPVPNPDPTFSYKNVTVTGADIQKAINSLMTSYRDRIREYYLSSVCRGVKWEGPIGESYDIRDTEQLCRPAVAGAACGYLLREGHCQIESSLNGFEINPYYPWSECYVRDSSPFAIFAERSCMEKVPDTLLDSSITEVPVCAFYRGEYPAQEATNVNIVAYFAAGIQLSKMFLTCETDETNGTIYTAEFEFDWCWFGDWERCYKNAGDWQNLTPGYHTYFIRPNCFVPMFKITVQNAAGTQPFPWDQANHCNSIPTLDQVTVTDYYPDPSALNDIDIISNPSISISIA
jgi:hypothetical protein